MDTYAEDVAELTAFFDLKNAIHIGHSTGGGEAIRYAAKYGKNRVSKVILISAVTPYTVKDKNNPEGVPIAVFDDIRSNTANNRQQFYSVDVPLLILHGEDDQIVLYNVTVLRAAKLVKNGKLITYPGLCHGMPTTDAATINSDILNFIK